MPPPRKHYYTVLLDRTRWCAFLFVISVHFRYHFSTTKISQRAIKISNISFASFDTPTVIGDSNFFVTKLNLSRYRHSPYVLQYYLKFYPFQKLMFQIVFESSAKKYRIYRLPKRNDGHIIHAVKKTTVCKKRNQFNTFI